MLLRCEIIVKQKSLRFAEMPARKFVFVVAVPGGWHIQFIQIIYYYYTNNLRPSVIVTGAATQFNNNIIRYDGYKRAVQKT